MRKRFIRVAVFCALTAVAAPVFTGCSDYDDDIRSLQEQIDQVKELPHISTADMTAAINSAIETLQGQMETAIAGKADNSTVSELQQLVAELTTLANGKADASEVIALSDRINDLIEEVNGLDGTLNQKLTALQEEIGTLQENLAKAQEDLNAALKDKADASEISKLQEAIAGINQTLAERLTEFNNVKEMAENNGEAIAEIQTQLTQLETLKSDISELQEANLEHIAKFQSLDTQLGGIDEEMDKLSARIEEVASSSATTETINSIISRIQALEDYKAQTLEALVSQANADHTWIENNKASLAQALTDISDLQSELSKYVTLEGLQANYYDKEAVDKKFNALDATLTDLGLLKNMIQSVVYVPDANSSYGQTMFYQLQVRNSYGIWTDAAQNKTTKLKIRVSPAKFAENFADNYDLTFDGFKMNRAASAFLKPENIKGDAKTGIVEMDVQTDIPAGDVYAVCLKVTPKAENKTDKYSDLTTNYFGVQHALLQAADVKTYCTNMNSGSLNFKGDKTVNYKEGREYYGFDVNGNPLANGTELTEIFGTDPFVTTYGYAQKSHESTFTIGKESGILGIAEDAKGSVAIIGRTVTAEANTSVGGIRTFTTPYSKITVDDVELRETLTLNSTDFKNFTGLKWNKADQKFELSDAAYIRIFKQEGMMGDNEFFTYDMKNDQTTPAYLEVDKVNKKIYLVIPAKTAIDKSFPTTLEVQYGKTSDGAVRKYVITCNVNAPMTYPTNKLTVDDHFWVLPENGGKVIFQPKTTLNGSGQITGIDFSMDLESAFLGYQNDKTAIETAGGTVDENWVINHPTPGTTLSGHTLTIDKNSYNNQAMSMGTEIKWGTHSEHKYKADIVVDGFSGSWEAGNTEPIYIRDRNQKDVKISDGFVWKDMWGYPMWKDGVAQFGNNTSTATYNYATGSNPFTLWGLTAPTYELVNASDSKYVTINSTNGTLNFTETGKTWVLVQPLEIKVRIKAASRWGAIDNYNEQTSTITIIVPAQD